MSEYDTDEPPDTAWKWTEENPRFREHCGRICARYGVVYDDFQEVRWAIEESILDDPFEGSVPLYPLGHPSCDENIRRFVYEKHPAHWQLPALVIVFRVEPPITDPRELTGLEIWSEEELGEESVLA